MKRISKTAVLKAQAHAAGMERSYPDHAGLYVSIAYNADTGTFDYHELQTGNWLQGYSDTYFYIPGRMDTAREADERRITVDQVIAELVNRINRALPKA